MSQVNLLPREVLQRQSLRRLTALIIAGGAIVLGLVLLFYLFQVGTLGGVRDEIAAQERTNEGIRDDIAELEQFAQLQAEARDKLDQLRAAFAGEASFSGILMDISRIIPSDAFLTQLVVQVAPPGGATEVPGSDPLFVGSLTTNGRGLDLDTIAGWLTRMEGVDGWENAWLQSATEAEGGGFTFTSSVDFSRDVVTPRGRGEVDGG
jgi:Tfp pilus assembly protein PilN